jgi:hypothetical protein
MEATGPCHALFTPSKSDGKRKSIETLSVSMHVNHLLPSLLLAEKSRSF